ncbi:MAG: hypothetical protein HYY16_13540 [Planctomycetes bacterium]|nr:hypothetical protein [Planctomycetota bacterium]
MAGQWAAWVGEHPFLTVALLTVLVESATACGRFMFGVQATRDTCALAAFTFGWRIHHAYVGALVLGISMAWPSCDVRVAITCVGSALVLSDLAHHFLVLWPITGRHEFDLTYPSERS